MVCLRLSKLVQSLLFLFKVRFSETFPFRRLFLSLKDTFDASVRPQRGCFFCLNAERMCEDNCHLVAHLQNVRAAQRQCTAYNLLEDRVLISESRKGASPQAIADSNVGTMSVFCSECEDLFSRLVETPFAELIDQNKTASEGSTIVIKPYIAQLYACVTAVRLMIGKWLQDGTDEQFFSFTLRLWWTLASHFRGVLTSEGRENHFPNFADSNELFPEVIMLSCGEGGYQFVSSYTERKLMVDLCCVRKS